MTRCLLLVLLATASCDSCPRKPAASALPRAAPELCEQLCRAEASCAGEPGTFFAEGRPDEILANCRREHAGCALTQTTDTLCCSVLKDCRELSRCVFSSRNAPVERDYCRAMCGGLKDAGAPVSCQDL